MRVKNQLLAKLALLLVLPVISVLLLAFVALLLVAAWALIPLSTVTIDETGEYKLRFPWGES